MKVCTKCGEQKPPSEFHRNRAARDGLRAECKACACARANMYYDEKLRPRFDTGPTSGVCAHCRQPFEYVKSTGPKRIYCSERCKYLGGDKLKQDRAPEHTRRCECGSTNVMRVGKPVCPDCRKDPRDNANNRLRERRRTMRLYNITQAKYDAMVEAQGDRCAICATDKPGGAGENWKVDHDHSCCPGAGSCGRCVRGLVCNNCNLAMGYAADDPSRLRAAAAYIEGARRSRLAA